MQYIVICSVALLASGLTLFSGFGLGTLLLPAFLLFFPADIAVAMTAIVHFANNIFKLFVLGRYADWRIVVHFGVPAVIAAFVGARVLLFASEMQPLTEYSFLGRSAEVTVVKLLMAVLILTFAVLEILPSAEKLKAGIRLMPLGGLLSGFFGGLSGHQGALRSVFLLHAGLSKEAFVATGVVIACLVDISRLSVYAGHLAAIDISANFPLIASATVCAFTGVFAGSRLLKKVTMRSVNTAVSILLFVSALALGFGVV